jgi:serine phosphatase RsbU (regulator of sigma subunit)
MHKVRGRLLCIVAVLACSVAMYGQQLKKKGLTGTAKEQFEHFSGLVEQNKKEGNKVQQADYLNKIAYLFWESGSSEDAVEYFKVSVDLNKEIGNDNGLQAIYTNIGLIYFDDKVFDQALKYFNLSLDINRHANKSRNICGNLINVALTHGEMDNFKKAVDILDEAYKISLELNDIRLMKTCLGMLYEYHENLGNSQQSVGYFNKYSALDKKIQQATLNKMEQETEIVRQEKLQTERKLQETFDTLEVRQQQIENLNLQSELERRQKELLEKEREVLVKESEAQKKVFRTTLIAFIGGVVSILIILLIIIINYRRNKKTNILLENKNVEIGNQRDIIEMANKNITHSINYAQRIQKALLPPANELKKLIPESFVFFQPRDIVSGDFYWFSKTKIHSVISESVLSDIKEMLPEKKVVIDEGIVISAVDCTGHGVPGAFMSMIGYNLIHEIISMGIVEPSKILSLLNVGIRNQLKQRETDNHDGMDMAICRIDTQNNKIEFAGAKNPLVYIKNGELTLVKGDFLPIGGFYSDNDEREYSKHVIEIDAPITCYLYSDGFADQIGGLEGKKFMSKNFRQLLLDISQEPMEEQQRILDNKLKEWIGTSFSQVDDILVIGFKLYPFK